MWCCAFNKHGAIRYFARPIFRLQNTKKSTYLQQQDLLTLIGRVVQLWNHKSTNLVGLRFKPSFWRLFVLLFIHLVSVSPLSRRIYCRVHRVKKLEEIVIKLIDRQLVVVNTSYCFNPTSGGLLVRHQPVWFTMIMQRCFVCESTLHQVIFLPFSFC